MKNTTVKHDEQSDVAALRSSPIHGITPLFAQPVEVEIDQIDLDPTNPGLMTQSLRDSRRSGSIRDSYDILAKIVYPILVCESEVDSKRYIHVDGYGRLREAKARGQQTITAIVYPPLSLEQRICLRQTLNAAQEPFDAVSIIKDLQTLAGERAIDLTNAEQIRTLVRDLPERVRKHEKDLVMLARLHPSAIEAMGESYKKNGNTIGLDKFREMARILRTMEDKHPKSVAKLGGPRELSLKVSKMYLDKKFSDGTKSQQAIREVAKLLEAMPANTEGVFDFFDKEKTHSELVGAMAGGAVLLGSNGQSKIVMACKHLTALLMDVDFEGLSPSEVRSLERTEAVLSKLLSLQKA